MHIRLVGNAYTVYCNAYLYSYVSNHVLRSVLRVLDCVVMVLNYSSN